MTRRTHVRIVLGREHYAIDVRDVAEVATRGDITPLPGAPAHVLGVRNLHGEAVPVIDLAVLTAAEGEGDRRVLVVLDADGRRAALAVDDVLDVEPLPPPSGDPRASGPVGGSTVVDGALVGILDAGALLDAAAWRPPVWA